MKRLLTAFGAFGFKYGNALIPLIIIFCFALAIPPHRVFGSKHIENAKDFVSLAIALTGLGLRFLTFALMPAREGNGAAALSMPARGGPCRRSAGTRFISATSSSAAGFS